MGARKVTRPAGQDDQNSEGPTALDRCRYRQIRRLLKQQGAREYVGCGPAAALITEMDALDRERRELERAKRREALGGEIR